jgi:hypothetical protein
LTAALRAAQPPVILPQPDHQDLRAVRQSLNFGVLEYDMLDTQQFLPWLGLPHAVPRQPCVLTFDKPARWPGTACPLQNDTQGINANSPSREQQKIQFNVTYEAESPVSSAA